MNQTSAHAVCCWFTKELVHKSRLFMNHTAVSVLYVFNLLKKKQFIRFVHDQIALFTDILKRTCLKDSFFPWMRCFLHSAHKDCSRERCFCHYFAVPIASHSIGIVNRCSQHKCKIWFVKCFNTATKKKAIKQTNGKFELAKWRSRF